MDQFSRVLLLIIIGVSLQAQSDAPQKFVTEHQDHFGRYTAIGEETMMLDKEGNPEAIIWSLSYLRKEGEQSTRRPVLFIFNGGPGSASVWLHMGLFGPQLAQVASAANEDDGAAPFVMIDNPYSLLDLVDLVFIDPVGTGYSRVVNKGKESNYWGLNEDAESIATFIRMWISKNQRWNAPKFIAGESFGTTRAAGVARALHQRGQDMALNGLVLISQALDYTGSTPEPDNLIAFLTYLPTMAATAWYHKKAGRDHALADFVEEARNFTYDEYAPALLRGNTLTADAKDHIAQRLAYFTGLDKAYILRADLRVTATRFRKELLRKEGLTIGGLDSRYTMEEYDQTAATPTHSDAASAAISSA